MKLRFYLWKILLPMLFLCVTLLGVSYSGWINSNKLITFLSSASMDYKFETALNTITLIHEDGTNETVNATITIDAGKVMNIELPDGSALLGLNCEKDILRIQYTLQAGNGEVNNISMKSVDQYLGDIVISLDRSSVECDYLGTAVSPDNFYDLLPATLGTFRVYHRFDGTNGTIDLIPVQLPTLIPVMLKKENIPIEVSDENPEEDATLVLRGKYNFTIPLNYDQYNAK